MNASSLSTRANTPGVKLQSHQKDSSRNLILGDTQYETRGKAARSIRTDALITSLMPQPPMH